MKSKNWLFLGFLIIILSCKDEYYPEIIESGNSYLVVEGVLCAGPDSTVIRLTKTAKLYSSGFTDVQNAKVTVEGRDNSIKGLVSSGNGRYVSPGLNLTVNNDYRLRIRTAEGKEYLSEYVTVRDTPPIDSLTWKQNPEGVRLYVSTHDVSDNTHYYLWNYDETWEIRTVFYATYIYDKPVVRQRVLPAEQVNTCWKYGSSKEILAGSSVRLQSGVISEAPLEFITTGDERICVRYSMLVRQYTLDKAGYEFYQLMKKNTEDIGTIFDAQPTEVRGNIVCVSNPGEPVIGYISASTVTRKRIFISHAELSSYWYLNQDCPEIRVKNNPDSIREAYEVLGLSPYEADYDLFGNISGYFSSFKPCVDCKERNGSTTRPAYW